MATARKRPGDLTGILAEEGAAAHKEELAKRAQEISMLAAAEQEDLDTPVDYSQGPAKPVKQQQELDIADEVEVHPATMTVRIIEDLESTTFGAGNHYELKKNQLVTLPYDFAQHLIAKGRVWDGNYRG